MTLVICPLHEVDAAIRRWRPSHVISMASPGAEMAQTPDDLTQLRLTFHDIAEPREGLRAASVADVDRLLTFALTWQRTAPLLIQCWAGVSRSPAAAYVVGCALTRPGQEEDLAARIRAAAPFATPNPRLVSLADAALNRNGAMSDAIARIGRGQETDMGRSFELALM